MTTFPTPRNLNIWYTFGAILTFFLGLQIVSGVVLAMHYVPSADLAFTSVEKIMRDVNYGWLIRYLHANGASMFFLAVYLHMFRGLYYGSYKAPREVLWILGMLIYVLMMATAFFGYVLPWGQMSFWGATVITSLFSAIPYVGQRRHHLAVGRLCGRRRHAEPLLLAALSAAVRDRRRGRPAHLGAARAGQQQPARDRRERAAGHRAFPSLLHDEGRVLSVAVPHPVRGLRVLRAELLRQSRQLHAGQSAGDPPEIVPEWYLLPFYAMLRSVPQKLIGVLVMVGALVTPFLVPWLDTSKVRSCRFRPLMKQCFWLFVLDCLLLGYAGSQSADAALNLGAMQLPLVWLARLGTAYYYGYFWVLMPLVGRIEKPKALPESIAKSVLGGKGGRT